MNRASETVVKKARWLTLLKRVKLPLLTTAGVYTATSVYSVHVSQVQHARSQLMKEYEISSDLIAELSPGVDINGLSPAHWCCINNDVEGLKLLIKEYCPTQLGLGTISSVSIPSILSRQRIQKSPSFGQLIHDRMSSFLSRWSWFSFHEYFLNSLKEGVYRELAHLEDINPVQCAVFFGSDKLIEYLISQEMLDFGQKDSAGNCLLTYAALSEHTHVADILVKTGQFDIDHRNNQGHTILQLCANQGKTKSCKFLLKNGADINALGPNGAMGAVRLCEHQFDMFEVQVRRGLIHHNPFEECLEFLEEHAEELQIRLEKSKVQ